MPTENESLKAYSYSFASTYADGGYVFGTVAARTEGDARKSLLRHFWEQGHTSVKEGDLRILQPSVAIEPGAILVAAEKA